MAINTKRITKGIYCHQWQGHVTSDDVVSAFKLEQSMAQADGCVGYIVILDGADVRTFPMNIGKMSHVVSGNEIATLIHKAPSVGKKLGEIVGAFVKTSIEFYDDWDETVARAHQLIEKNRASVFPSRYV